MTNWTELKAFLRSFGRGFAAARHGGVAMMFALSMPVLTMMAVCGLDIHRASSVRQSLQDSLDAATLAAARSGEITNAGVQEVGMRVLRANLAQFPYVQLNEAASATNFVLNPDGSVTSFAGVSVDTIVAGAFLGEELQVNVDSLVFRSSQNVEVSLVLDTTGSMAGQRIVDLRAAAAELVNIVVQDVQTPFYSKVALVPYSMAVNVGDYADAARGTTTPPTAITGASWAATTPAARTITGATRGNPVVITSNGHGFNNGDWVWISGVRGMTQLNNRAFQVANRANNTFQLAGVNGGNYSSYSSGGTVRRCQVANCEVVVTSSGHGLANGDRVYITGVGGMTQINNQSFLIANRTASSFSLVGANPSLSLGNYTSGGSAFCTTAGCRYFAFTNAEGNLRVHPVSTCVTERAGAQAYTDASPSVTRLGRNYPSTNNPCLTNRLVPLSSDRAQLVNQINQLQASGSTGGHIGVAWGWYTVSPNFSGLFSGASRPGSYGDRELIKVVVIMTDGEYNSAYCNGVIARSSTTGSGSPSDHINCDAPNGHPFDQTTALCTRMKNAGVVVYTVGFNVVNDERARTMVSQCASSADHVYLPTSGSDLRSAFRAIGQDIARLRIAR